MISLLFSVVAVAKGQQASPTLASRLNVMTAVTNVNASAHAALLLYVQSHAI
jgi:hypothetical protein